VDQVQDLQIYKDFEDQLNQFSNLVDPNASLTEKQALWQSLTSSQQPQPTFVPQNRDVVKQLQASFGFRVTAARYNHHPQSHANTGKDGDDDKTRTTVTTRSVLVTSPDPEGVQIVVTALHDENSSTTTSKNGAQEECGGGNEDTGATTLHHFDPTRVQQFLDCHNGGQGIAVLAFTVNDVTRIKTQYEAKHPALVADYQEYDNHNVKVLEVFAYYQPHQEHVQDLDRKADQGTILRFIQSDNENSQATSMSTGSSGTTPKCPLPGLLSVPAVFETNAQPAYCDHWVSNVFSRTEFLDTLHDTLGFTPKVDFNAGVVAAGEAQIESTVTGNDSVVSTNDKTMALKDQSQVYLPINNALSSVGHVHGFLQEIGQGVQHVASRVEDLVEFVQRGNDYRKITNEGFTFLRIPRSYYGVLSLDMLTSGITGDGSDTLTEQCAQELLDGLKRQGTLTKEGALDLDMSRTQLDQSIQDTLSGSSLVEYQERKDSVLDVVMRSRYKNLYSLLRDNVSEKTYLGIVRNQILVDIQGDDLLYQIFTSNILQRKAGEEAPFFEYIQRVCSECIDETTGCPQKIRPGCGGFGIRNFLTLFLSIEVSKAMQDVTDAQMEGDMERQAYAQSMVDCFTEQLNEANPILTAISDAMTLEGQLKEELAQAMMDQDHDAIALLERKMVEAAEDKLRGNKALMACSMRYNDRMKALREQRERQQLS
jgi:4-hydroxyphenylpyruvate dioxygenase-like putative hemolysin